MRFGSAHAVLTAAAFAACVAASAAHAGIVITEQSGEGAAAKTDTIELDTAGMRESTPTREMIYRADQHLVWLISPAEKTYREMTEADIGALAQRRDQMLKALPEAQRKRLAAIMGESDGPAPVARYQVDGPARTVGKWSCVPYQRIVDGQSTVILCLGRLSALGLSHDDLAPIASLAAFARPIADGPGMRPFALPDFDELSKAVGFDAVPLQTTTTKPDGSTTTRTIIAIDRKSLPPGTFDLPAGLTKQDMPGMAGRAR